MINILLIDDDEDEYIIFSDAVQTFQTPARCLYAAGARQAFEILDQVRPDLIFVDMNMPMVNGVECIKKLKDMHVGYRPLIVPYSTFINEELRYNAMLAGADECLQKPASMQMLIDKLAPFFSSFD